MATGDYDKVVKELSGAESLEKVFGGESGSNMTKEQGKAFFKDIFSHLTYKIGAAEAKDDKTVNVKVKVSNVNFSTVMSTWITNVFNIALTNADKSEAEVMSLMFADFTNQVNAAVEKGDMAEKEIEIKMVNKDGSWIMDPSDEAMDGLLGGFINASKSLSN